MARQADIPDVDEALLARVAALSPGGQRWLKTAIQAIRNVESVTPAAPAPPAAPERKPARPKALPKPQTKPPASLEDVISGKADLREHLNDYPELSTELEGLADIIEMLREVGERRRRKGEQILREEILGEPPADDEEDKGRAKDEELF
jgi:hypothetical protein